MNNLLDNSFFNTILVILLPGHYFICKSNLSLGQIIICPSSKDNYFKKSSEYLKKIWHNLGGKGKRCHINLILISYHSFHRLNFVLGRWLYHIHPNIWYYFFLLQYMVSWENDKKMTLEFELDKMGSPISTWTNKG